jgi:hypothetical protein
MKMLQAYTEYFQGLPDSFPIGNVILPNTVVFQSSDRATAGLPMNDLVLSAVR